jgi:hypothetical protein
MKIYKLSLINKISYIVFLSLSFIVAIGIPSLLIFEKPKMNNYVIGLICFIIFEIIAVFLCVYYFLIIKNHKIFMEDNILIINNAFITRRVDLEKYSLCEHILLHKFNNVIKLTSDKKNIKTVLIYCRIKNEDELINDINKILYNNKYKWYYSNFEKRP